MEDLNAGRPPTPAHHPTSDVRIFRQEIEDIASFAFPGSQLLSVVQLPSGKSYNNRIYFLNLRHSPTQAECDDKEQRVVLKVNGRFFGGNKVQNEVACLQLIQKYCRDIPAPRPLAWSEDGSRAASATSSNTFCTLGPPFGALKFEHGGWILMTEVEGDPAPTSDLDATTLVDLGHQLGDIVASLRQRIPHQTECGNIRLPILDLGSGEAPKVEGWKLTIRDVIQEGININQPITNANQYYQIRLADKIGQLQASEALTPNRYLVDPLSNFMKDTLPKLELAGGSGVPGREFVFTHYDLSPRNVLVSGNPLRITGLVDFEFAGFFPAVEEFLNDYLSNTDDWSHTLYDSYLARLESLGVVTPKEGIEPDVWMRNLKLETMAMNIAPWDLPGGYSEDELACRLREAAIEIQEMIHSLS